MSAQLLQGNVFDTLPTITLGSVDCARNTRGQFVKGKRPSRATEFKKGEHWRPHAIFRDRDYLVAEYVVKKRTVQDIASEHGVRVGAIWHWMSRHGITGRTMSEIRKSKRWAAIGPANPMFGKRGPQTPSWKGGITPERQAFYSSAEWFKVWRQTWNRDKKRCQRCKSKWEKGRKFDVHHIVGFEVRELRAVLSNLILLCRPCHCWVHSKANTVRLFLSEAN